MNSEFKKRVEERAWYELKAHEIAEEHYNKFLSEAGGFANNRTLYMRKDLLIGALAMARLWVDRIEATRAKDMPKDQENGLAIDYVRESIRRELLGHEERK